jgi:hypothetical protein
MEIKSIVILGKFDDDLIRQVLCKQENQLPILDLLKSLSPDGVVQVIDKPLDGIMWEYDETITK